MGTLSEELGPHAERLVARPRIYADANVPAGLVAHMRAAAALGRAVRARGRRSAPRARREALPARAAAAAHAGHAGSRLPRRPPVSARRQRRRARHPGAGRAPAVRRCSIASTACCFTPTRRTNRWRCRWPAASCRSTPTGDGNDMIWRCELDDARVARRRRRRPGRGAGARARSTRPAISARRGDEGARAGSRIDGRRPRRRCSASPRSTPSRRRSRRSSRSWRRGSAAPLSRNGAVLVGNGGRGGGSLGRRGARRQGRRVLCGRPARHRRRRPRRRALTGARGRAGSVAWLSLNPVEREDYRKIGCLEAEVAAAGIVRRLIWRIKAGDRSRVQDIVKDDLAAITVEHVLDAARDGDGVSISVVRDTAKYLGMAAANLVVVADPGDAGARRHHGVGGGSAARADSDRDRAASAEADDGCADDRDRHARRGRRGASAPRVSSPRRFHDRPVGRRAGAARPHPVARHAGHRGRTDRRRSGPTRRRAATPAFAFHGHYIVPGLHRRARARRRRRRRAGLAAGRRRGRGDRRAAAALRRHRRSVRRPWRAGRRRCGACSIRCAARANAAPAAIGARAAGAPREQLHQPGVQRRAARGLLAQSAGRAWGRWGRTGRRGRTARAERSDFTAADILAEIERAAPDVGIVTLASELDGGLDLVRWLVVARTSRVARALRRDLRRRRSRRSRPARGTRRTSSTGCRRSATARRGWSARCCRPTRSPRRLICDGVHVHPALIRTAIAAKRPSRIFAITDATAAAGLPVGAQRHARRPADYGRRADRAAARRHHRRQRADHGSRVSDADRPRRSRRWSMRRPSARPLRRASSVWSDTACWRPTRWPTWSSSTRISRWFRPTSRVSSSTRGDERRSGDEHVEYDASNTRDRRCRLTPGGGIRHGCVRSPRSRVLRCRRCSWRCSPSRAASTSSAPT